MAIDTRIPLMTQVPDVNQAFFNALTNIATMDEIRRNREQEGVTNRLLEAQAATAEFKAPTGRDIANKEFAGYARAAGQLARDLGAGIRNQDASEILRIINRHQQAYRGQGDAEMVDQFEDLKERVTAGDIASLSDWATKAKEVEDYYFKRQGNIQFGAQDLVRDSKGNLYQSTTAKDPKTGGHTPVYSPVTPGAPPVPVGDVEVVGSSGMTPSQQVEHERQLLDQRLEHETDVIRAKSANKTIDSAFDAMSNARSTITNLEDALVALREGASTGPVYDLLPSFRSSTRQLENARKRLGLNVVGAVTFGALSKGELDVAMDVGLPTGLEPEELEKEIIKRISAQAKLINYLEGQTVFLNNGGTVAGWIEKQNEELQKIMEFHGVTNADITRSMQAQFDDQGKRIRGPMTRSEVLTKLRQAWNDGISFRK